MDFAIPPAMSEDLARFNDFIKTRIIPNLPSWNRQRELPQDFFHQMGEGGWFGLRFKNGSLARESALMEALVAEALAVVSPGVAIAALAHIDLGLMGLYLFGSPDHHRIYSPDAARGNKIMCLGNTENLAGSDVAGIALKADKIDDGWILNGTKAYVTNGYIADLGVITAVSDPEAARNSRLSMYLVDLDTEGVSRKKLNKQVWIPSDLTRLKFDNVFVPEDQLLGIRGRGLQQVLEIFTNSRVPISALTLGGAVGAFNLAVDHMQKRKIFGDKIINYQAKAFEIFMPKLNPPASCSGKPAGKSIRPWIFARPHLWQNTWRLKSPGRQRFGRPTLSALPRSFMNIPSTNTPWTPGGRPWAKAPRMCRN